MLSYNGHSRTTFLFLSGSSAFGQIHISKLNLLCVCVRETLFVCCFSSCRENRGFQVRGVSQEKRGTLEQTCVAFRIQTFPGDKLYLQSKQYVFWKVTPGVAGHCGAPWRCRTKGRPWTPWTKGSELYLDQIP